MQSSAMIVLYSSCIVSAFKFISSPIVNRGVTKPITYVEVITSMPTPASRSGRMRGKVAKGTSGTAFKPSGT